MRATTCSSPARARRTPSASASSSCACCAGRVDALLIVPAGADHRYLPPEIGAGTPIVFLDRPPRGVEADTVLLDNLGGARAATEHLLRHGHERIAYVGDLPPLYTAAERLAGYRAALRDAGVRPDEGLVSAGSHDAAAAERAVRALLALPADRRPTALFTANNRNTVGALRALLTATGRSRWSASTTSSWPTCSRCR